MRWLYQETHQLLGIDPLDYTWNVSEMYWTNIINWKTRKVETLIKIENQMYLGV